MAVQHTQLSS